MKQSKRRDLGLGFSSLVMSSVIRSSVWIALAACGGSDVPPPAAAVSSVPVPAWVDRVPEQKGKVCALGTAEPTFYREDGKIYAAENARNQLAMTISVRVQAVMIDIQEHDSSFQDSTYVQEAQSYATDAVVAGAQVLSYWYDEFGSRGRKSATYALGCLSTDASATQIAERLQQAHPENKDKIAEVRERAKAAFDNLEAEETKRLGGK